MLAGYSRRGDRTYARMAASRRRGGGQGDEQPGTRGRPREARLPEPGARHIRPRPQGRRVRPGAARSAGRRPGRPADLPRLAARHLPATPRHPRHVARATPARVRQAILVHSFCPSRTAQPPLRAPVVGRELPSRKDGGGGTTAGTTGIASGFLTRIKFNLSTVLQAFCVINGFAFEKFVIVR